MVIPTANLSATPVRIPRVGLAVSRAHDVPSPIPGMAQCAKSQGFGDRVPIFQKCSLPCAVMGSLLYSGCCRPAFHRFFPLACPASAADIRLPFALVAQRSQNARCLKSFCLYGRDILGAAFSGNVIPK